MTEAQEILAKRLRNQASACRMLGSELYASLLEHAAEDVETGGATFEVMMDVAYEPPGAAVALRLMGGVHRLVLEGRAPGLAEFYPSVGGTRDPDGSWPAFHATLRTHLSELQRRIHESVQTNEVGRCAGLVGGFLEVARGTGLPLRMIEIGCSGGLNLRWDHYRYVAPVASWGDAGSPVILDDFETAPDLDAEAVVVERLGCDPHPVAADTPEGRLTLSSFVWPDQEVRWTRLGGALDVAARVPVEIHRAGAAEFLAGVLAEPRPGVATVVFHSIVFQYLDIQERTEVATLLAEAGRRAAPDAPLAQLSMEPPARHLKTWFGPVREGWDEMFPEPSVPAGQEDLAVIHLRVWPAAPASRLVGRAGYHGSPVHWAD